VRKNLEHVRCFLSNVRWSTKDAEGGSGVTWIELYALYMCKGMGEKRKKYHLGNPLKPHESLQKAVAAFKVQCRRVRIMCVDEGDEHNLHTGYSQVNRLRPLGISNRHAAIVGMPVLN
jgi:hypothetical protein